MQPGGVWGCGGLGTDLLGRRGQEEPGGQGRWQQGWQEPDTNFGTISESTRDAQIMESQNEPGWKRPP